jgi:hypothetical protein
LESAMRTPIVFEVAGMSSFGLVGLICPVHKGSPVRKMY